MARFFAVWLGIFVLFMSFPSSAQMMGLEKDGPTTTDPNNKGYAVGGDDELYPVEWIKISALCDPCEATAEAYNQAVQSLLNTRFWIAFINDLVNYNESRLRLLRNWEPDFSKDGKGLSALDEQASASALSYRMGLDDLGSKLPALKAQKESLESLVSDLENQLDVCEGEQCKPGKESLNVIPDAAKKVPQLPFDWKGPYPEACHKCAKLAARLNELPRLALAAEAGLEKARAEQIFIELDILSIQINSDGVLLPDPNSTKSPEERARDFENNKKKSQQELSNLEKKRAKAEEEIEKYEHDLDAITKNFDETLALYNECVPTCEKQTGMTDPVKKNDALAIGVGASVDFGDQCFSKLNFKESYVIGPNSEYGTGAAMRDKIKDQATGAAMGALGGLMGGGGIKLGGGGGMDDEPGSPMGGSRGGGNSDGPKLDKDPLKGEPFEFKWEGMYIGMKAGFVDDEFRVSQQIKDSPDGNSTFHAMWLENMQGQRILPDTYYVFDIYRDNKLTVWWTYDHWTNGVHDYHDEGEESTAWRDDLGSFKVRFDGEKGIKNSLWYTSGYDTATDGVRSMGAGYKLTQNDLIGCGLNAVTHFTLPDQDPVVTMPTFVNLHLDNGYDPAKPKIIFTVPQF